MGGVNAGCDSAHFSTHRVGFDHICGQTKSYQKGNSDAFVASVQSINEPYVDGISITLGSPHQHVWTYAVCGRAGIKCPCAATPGPAPPAFVKENYYSDSGYNGEQINNANFYLSNPLWDGDGCPNDGGCCAALGMPWFYRKIPTRLSEAIEVRICKNEPHSDEDTAIEMLEIYVL